MKKTEVIIYNESNLPLKVARMNNDYSDRSEFNVKGKESLNLKTGQYNIAFFYQSAKLELESNMNDALKIGHIHSQSHNKFLGKLIEVNNPKEQIIIKCNNLN